MGFFNFLKKKKEDKEIERIFCKINNYNDAKAMVDRALSFRNLGQYDKAISILHESEKKYPFYAPGKTILGVTLMKTGRINDAENNFLEIINSHHNDENYSLLEVYANLGVLYYFHKNNKEKAIQYYDLALKQPKTEKMDEKPYKIMLSNVYGDLAFLFFLEKDHRMSKQHALRSLELNENCRMASKIYGMCLLNEFSSNPERIKYVVNSIESKELQTAIKYLEKALSEDNNDIECLLAMALAYYYLNQMKYYKNIEQKIKQKMEYYYGELKEHSNNNSRAKECLDMYHNATTNFGMEIMTKVYGMKVEVANK